MIIKNTYYNKINFKFQGIGTHNFILKVVLSF